MSPTNISLRKVESAASVNRAAASVPATNSARAAVRGGTSGTAVASRIAGKAGTPSRLPASNATLNAKHAFRGNARVVSMAEP